MLVMCNNVLILFLLLLALLLLLQDKIVCVDMLFQMTINQFLEFQT